LIPALNHRFRELDGAYNSQLFAPHLSETLTYEPHTLAHIIEELYGSAASFIRYNFAFIDADVLGRAYEQYLGSVISEHQEVEAKKAKRKSQGIYYTPTFVVKYIVQQTLGRYLQENGYNPSRPLRVLDPACGSGSFLIEAFDVLDQFLAHEKGQDRAKTSEVFKTSEVYYDIHDYARRMQILTQNIFGVDKDEQAVEVAQLNLLLKALHLRDKLPKLDNIRHGDSLISGDAKELEKYFGAGARDKHAFNWDDEFRAVMKDGGFDVVIGNPPYVRAETLGQEFKAYTQSKFSTSTGQTDLYVCFIEQAHRLLKPDGYFGMIVSNKFMRSHYGKALREFLTSKTMLLQLIDFGELPVFQDAAAMPVIIITQNRPAKAQRFIYAPIKRLDFATLDQEIAVTGTQLDERALQDGNWTLSSGREQSILDKMRRVGVSLSEYVGKEVYFGIKTGYNEAFVIDRATRQRLIAKDAKSAKLIKPFVVGDDVRKYQINYQDRYLILIPKG
jgi:adenine-specific DNA-methyltransferase